MANGSRDREPLIALLQQRLIRHGCRSSLRHARITYPLTDPGPSGGLGEAAGQPQQVVAGAAADFRILRGGLGNRGRADINAARARTGRLKRVASYSRACQR